MEKKTMVLNFKDDAYFYKFGEQSRVNEVLYEIRETINKNFKKYPFVTDISYYLKRDENSYNYVATITYETDETDEPDSKPFVEKTRTFKMCLKKCNYCNIENAKFENENQMKINIEKYFDKLPNCHIINVDTKWYDEGDNLLLVGHVTYRITSDVIDECPCF